MSCLSFKLIMTANLFQQIIKYQSGLIMSHSGRIDNSVEVEMETQCFSPADNGYG